MEAGGRETVFPHPILKRTKGNVSVEKHQGRIRKYLHIGKSSASIVQEALLFRLFLVRCQMLGKAT